MRSLFSVFGLSMVFSGLLSTVGIAEVKTGKYPRVYKGNEGIKVTVVELPDTEPKKVLVQVSGVQTKIDDVVLMHTEIPDNKSFALETYINDDKFWTLRSEQHWYGGKNLVLTLPEAVREKISLYYDEELSKKVDAKAMGKLYEQQLADGTIGKVQRYSGKDLEPHSNRAFKGAVNDAKTSCNAPIGAKIDWQSFNATHKKSLAVVTLCRQPAELLVNMCDGEEKVKMAGKIEGITCSVGSSQNLSLKAKRLMWQIPGDRPIDEEALKNQLDKLFK